MLLRISVKQAGKKKPVIAEREIELERPQTLRQLLESIVTQEVAAYDAKTAENTAGCPQDSLIFKALTENEMEDLADTGKIGFGARYNAKQQNLEEAIDNALQSFEDGLYRVFINDEEVRQPDEPLSLQEGARLTFFRLTMLAGRLW